MRYLQNCWCSQFHLGLHADDVVAHVDVVVADHVDARPGHVLVRDHLQLAHAHVLYTQTTTNMLQQIKGVSTPDFRTRLTAINNDACYDQS